MSLLLRLIIIAILLLSILLIVSLLLRQQGAARRWLTLGYPPRDSRPPLLPAANRGALQVAATADWRAADEQRHLGEHYGGDGRPIARYATEYNLPKWVHAALLEELARVGFEVTAAEDGGELPAVPVVHSELIDARVRPAENDALLVLGARLLDAEGRECLVERYEMVAEPAGARASDTAWADALEQALQQAAQMIAFDVVARLPAPQDDEPVA